MITLTDVELEIMRVLWDSETPLTGAEIIDVSPVSKSWKDSSIHIIMRSLQRKNAVDVIGRKATATNNARIYAPLLTPEEYSTMQVNKVNVDVPEFFAAFMKGKSLDSKTKRELLALIDEMDEQK